MKEGGGLRVNVLIVYSIGRLDRDRETTRIGVGPYVREWGHIQLYKSTRLLEKEHYSVVASLPK